MVAQRIFTVTWMARNGIKSRQFRSAQSARNFANSIDTAGCLISSKPAPRSKEAAIKFH